MLHKIEKIRVSEIGNSQTNPSGYLTLAKAWPRSHEHLSLEYISAAGQRIPGQWLKDPEVLQRVARQTSRSSGNPRGQVIPIPKKGVLLQIGGVDRHLVGLAELLSNSDATLIIHRPERRAVVEFKDVDQSKRFIKVVRPKKVRGMVAVGRKMKNLANGWFRVPELLEWSPDTGVTVWSELQGTSLFQILITPRDKIHKYGNVGIARSYDSECRLAIVCQAVGAALRELHGTRESDGIPQHNAEDETSVIRKWLNHLQVIGPDIVSRCENHFGRVADGLMKGHSRPALIHRDFYDKQILYSRKSGVGLLDFDTIAVGEAALDLANVLVHFELRYLQGRCSFERVRKAAQAFIQGYDPNLDVRKRLSAYADASRLRLACVYAFRPMETATVSALIRQVGQPLPGSN